MEEKKGQKIIWFSVHLGINNQMETTAKSLSN